MSVDLRTTYLGLELANPLVPSASTLSSRIDNLRRLEDAGAAAVVMQSLFEEQIEHDEIQLHRVLETATESFPEALTHFPELEEYNTGPDEYLRHLEKTKHELRIPVIGSLNGVSRGGWLRYAKLIQDAGADALELNVYLVAADPDETGEQVERRYLDLVSEVRETVTIPLAVKIGPYFSSVANMARRLVEAGADGLVLFNRYYDPDIDVQELNVIRTLQLSDSSELALRLRGIAVLAGRVKASLAVTGGVHTALDVVKATMAGAHVTQMVSALLKNGPDHLGRVCADLKAWMEENEWASLNEMRGNLSQERIPNPQIYERANYMLMLQTWEPR
jgi:dihydroorotate dehydrogenase (fumarate)